MVPEHPEEGRVRIGVHMRGDTVDTKGVLHDAGPGMECLN
jgi:hypothetical protein